MLARYVLILVCSSSWSLAGHVLFHSLKEHSTFLEIEINVPAVSMLWLQTSLIITQEWEYSS